MTVLQALKWINRHGTACALLAMLLVFCAAVHTIAVTKLTVFSGVPLGTLPPRLVRSMAGIQFFHANWWFALPYLLLFLGALIYMEIRATPRWAVWSTFGLMSLPTIGYLSACTSVGACFVTVMGPIHGP